MTLGQKQRIFCNLVSQLINWAYAQGYELTFGEAYRTPEQAALNAAKGSGIQASNHTRRLAVDLNLFIAGEYRSDSEAYKPLGEYWEALSTDEVTCCWGGRFSRPDGNHFSLEHEGVK